MSFPSVTWTRRDRHACSVVATLIFGSQLIGCATASVGITRAQRAAADSVARIAVQRERDLDPSTYPARTIGVAPLTVFATDTSLQPLGLGIADLLITDLARSGRVTVVDRVNVDALMRELGLALRGHTESISAPRFGKLLGASRLVAGTIVQLPDQRLQLGARIADTRSSEIGPVVDETTPLEAILDAEKALVFRLFDELGITLAPAERAAIEQRPTRNITAFLAYSRGIRAEMMNELSSAVFEYESASTIDPAFNLARMRLTDLRAVLDTRGVSDGRSQLRRAGSVASEAINPGGLRSTNDATDPSFRSTTIQATVVVVVRIP